MLAPTVASEGQAMVDKKVGKHEKAAKKKAMLEKAKRDKAGRDKASRDKASRDKAGRDRAGRDKAGQAATKRAGSKRSRRSYFPVDAPAVARAVEEGVLMSRTALTMATMNHIIIGAVRDKVDYNPEQVAEFVEAELHQLALEQAELAEHMKRLQLEFPPLLKRSRTIADYQWLTRRRVAYSALASELDRLNGDPDFISEAVDASQKWAWSELSRAIEGRLDVAADLRSSPEYEYEREGRLHELRDDLAALATSRASG
ncbi:MAG: hypothetical protein JWQ64_2596 [Subtercola sp.]|nr:hypothetical protein [Subtercola sp.]